jgi:hypothetical protein
MILVDSKTNKATIQGKPSEIVMDLGVIFNMLQRSGNEDIQKLFKDIQDPNSKFWECYKQTKFGKPV